MGSLDTAKLLLEHPGTWRTESSAVCRSIAMALESITDRYIGEERCKKRAEILRLMLYPKMKTLPPKEQIFRENYLQPVSFVDICSANALGLQLEGGFCTETDGQMLLDKLDGRKRYEHRLSEKGITTKLLLIKKYYPQLCRGSRAKGIFLEKLYRQYILDEPYQGLLKAWKQLLLEKGCDPNEIGSGHECRFFARRKDFSEESIMLTPLLAAVLFGRKEAARVLMEHGASCDLSKKSQLKVLFMGSAESLAVAQKLSLPGIESISRDDLAGIRISTAPNGSRTRFWEEMKTGSCVQA